MSGRNSKDRVRGYCSQCSCHCPTVAHVQEDTFIEVESDKEHPHAVNLCPKGLAGPELVHSKQRLRYPMRRTRPKTDPNAGWEPITWQEALDSIATKLGNIKAEFGPEAVAVARSGPAGSPMWDLNPWVTRLSSAFGTPNTIATTHICQWHRDNGSAYTFGKPGTMGTAGRPEFERTGCMLVWGTNVHSNRISLIPFIKRGLERGAKLIAIDPRKTEMAALADLWLQVCPGTDGALALSMINVMLEEDLYDHGFVKDWTNAPLLVRGDTGNFLKANDFIGGSDPSSYVIVDSQSESPDIYTPGMESPLSANLDTEVAVKLVSGEEVECKTAFRLLRESVSEYSPSRVESLTWIPEGRIRAAARMIATARPACWYSWNGIEQSTNAAQTNRAVCILYALTGDYDTPGGNVILPKPAVNPVEGHEFLSPEVMKKRLGFRERPAGPAGTAGSIQAYDVYRAILHGRPYPIKAILGFGGNLVTSNPPAMVAREALLKLDFHVQVELFLTPTAQLADVILPAASCWESWHVGIINADPLGPKPHVQLRPAVVSPQHESWPDMKIIFELAKRLSLGDKFWEGNIEAGFDYVFAPSNITVEKLKKAPGGICLDLPMEYQKYRKQEDGGSFLGFPTPSKRLEIYSSTFKGHGYNPLPDWKEPRALNIAQKNVEERYPLILTCGKVIEYCHSQHRALPSLRRRVPYPFLEINPSKAGELGCKDGDWVILQTPQGGITLQAKLTDSIPLNVVSTQNGWWQECTELNLPGFDPYAPEGANINLVYSVEEIDPISGSLPLKGYPCTVRKR